VLSQNTQPYPYRIMDCMSTGMNRIFLVVNYKGCSGNDEKGVKGKSPVAQKTPGASKGGSTVSPCSLETQFI